MILKRKVSFLEMNLNLITLSLVKEINLKIERGQKIFLLKNLKKIDSKKKDSFFLRFNIITFF